MKFNQVIWDALCWAEAASQTIGKASTAAATGYRRGQILLALELYADACDGKVQTQQFGDTVLYVFIPNPIPKY